MKADFTLYLVTDSTRNILGDRDISTVVEAALQGGVTIVQYRDKTKETAELILEAQKLHNITRKYNVPLIINDRLDIALAVGAEGVHIGQEDVGLALARRIMGPESIIGVSASSVEEALAAASGGATYIGISTLYESPTKLDSKSVIGHAGVRDILQALSSQYQDIPTVCIGGVNQKNAQRVLHQSATTVKSLDGVAVVSAIIAAQDPTQASFSLLNIVKHRNQFYAVQSGPKISESASLLAKIPSILRLVAEKKPLNHNMTNLVVQNFAANIAIAIGSSPIMSASGLEAAELAALGGSLVINIGTVTADSLRNFLTALRAYNEANGPVLFDPVGGGATSIRRDAVRRLLAEGYFDVIKGNVSEIQAVIDADGIVQHGVDSSSKMQTKDKAKIVKDLATRERNIVLMTGETDFLSDGSRTYAISNGHPFLGNITGSGCALGTTIAAALAVERRDKLSAVLAGLLLYEIAAERTAARPEVQGPGTFVCHFIDELYNICTNLQDCTWLDSAKVIALRDVTS